MYGLFIHIHRYVHTHLYIRIEMHRDAEKLVRALELDEYLSGT